MTAAASVRYYTPIPGIPITEIGRLDLGWYYECEGDLIALEQLPCSLDKSGGSLYLVHDLYDIDWDDGDVLAFQTRYESIRVWADDTVIYEAAQGKEHALSSMWHFISSEQCKDASLLRIELIRYDQKTNWTLSSVLMDHPDAILMNLLRAHAPAILFWIFCMIFALLLIFVIILMTIRKIKGVSTIIALAAFIFLSGQWILLDSKVTALFGGNYALTYFLSYVVFYLLPMPFIFYVQLMLDQKSRILRYLSWAVLFNAVICMGLHLFGLVPIRNTTIFVHILILLTVFISVWKFFLSAVKYGEKKLICTFFGVVLICVASLVSIILYRVNILPPTNNAVLFSWALLLLAACMTIDTVSAISRFWKQNQYLDHYRQLAVQDSMTGLENRNAYESRIKAVAQTRPNKLAFILFDVDNLKMLNDNYGHHVGDQAIYISAQCVSEIFGSSGNCYRIGGDELCVIVTSPCDVARKLKQFDNLLKFRSNDTVPVTVSHGWAERSFEPGIEVTAKDITDLQNAADRDLYQQKNKKKQDVRPEEINPDKQ